MPTKETPPLFAIAVPAWRASATIGTAVASVLAQTETRFELIVIDDGCPDHSGAHAAHAANGDPRVRIVMQPNQGPSAARNAAVAASTAPLIAFLDADDRWRPETLARHRDAFADPSLGVSFARIRFFDSDLRVPGRVSAFVPNLTLTRAMGENPICTTSNLVARRAVFDRVGGFDAALTHAEDQEWVARVLATTDWRVAGLNTFLVDYRMSAGGLSADLDGMRRGWLAMAARLRAAAPDRTLAAANEAEALFERYLARRALRTRQPVSVALRHLLAAFARSPMALLREQPERTALTIAGILAATVLPEAPARALLSR